MLLMGAQAARKRGRAGGLWGVGTMVGSAASACHGAAVLPRCPACGGPARLRARLPAAMVDPASERA